MVEFVRHTFMNGTIRFNIDDIPDFVSNEVLAKFVDTVLSEALGEHVARTRSVTKGVRHFEIQKIN